MILIRIITEAYQFEHMHENNNECTPELIIFSNDQKFEFTQLNDTPNSYLNSLF